MPTWVKKYRRCVEKLENIKKDEQEMRENINKLDPWIYSLRKSFLLSKDRFVYRAIMSERCDRKIEYYKSRYGKHKIFKCQSKSKKYAHE